MSSKVGKIKITGITHTWWRWLMLSLMVAVWGKAQAVEVPAGTYYFDNSKLKYATVKFVYGNDAEGITHIVELKEMEHGRWTFDITTAASGQTHYFFTNTAIEAGTHNEKVTRVKDIIIERGEHRTQTFKDVDNIPMVTGALFVPNSSDLYTSGKWQKDGSSELPISGTLPVMYIDTENKTPITSKEEYIQATYYVDPMGNEDCMASGTKEAPLTLSIKGRGNWTWKGFDKKPYRLKLSAKEALLGMKKSKHFALLAGADDNLGFMRNPLGFELSKRMHLAWTPDCRPVEVVLNGDYIGLYFLTEVIRVDKDRVNVTEQDDSSDEDVTGGWLVEVDNYSTDPHISVKMSDKSQDIWITYKSPEVLSEAQENYLQEQFDAIRDAVYCKDRKSTEWENLVDMEAMARLYVVREIMQDEEGFHGSFYLHKERGIDTKWVAGPVWDFGNAYGNDRHQFIWDHPQFECFFIDQIYQFPRFQEMVRGVFGDFYRNDYPTIDLYIDSISNLISSAAVDDFNRWPTYGTNNIAAKASTIKSYLHDKVEWLAKQWGTTGTADMDITLPDPIEGNQPILIFDLQGRQVKEAAKSDTYIYKKGDKTWKGIWQ